MIKGNIHRQVIENSLKENSLTENDPRTAIIINNIDVKSLEIIEDMNRQILSLDLQVNGLQIAVNNQIAIIKKYETMCFWERLKYLLKGVAKCK